MLKNRFINRSAILFAGCSGLALFTAATTMAQNTTIIGGSGSSGVYINEQLIGSVPAYSNGFSNGYSSGYGPQNTPSGYPGSNGGEYLNRPGNLLYPPQNYLRSQITIQNFADFQPSGYTQQGYNTQAYSAPASPYAQQGYTTGLQQPGLASGNSLYNPYGQPLVPLSQVSQTRVTNTGDQPQYPTQVPAFQPQSQLLVPPPSGRTPVVQAPVYVKNNDNSTTSDLPPSTPVAITKVTTPSAPKVIKKAVAPVQIAKVPSPVTPPAPVISTTAPTQLQPSPVAAKVIEPPKTVPAKSPEPAPEIEAVVSEPILTPPPVPAPVTAPVTAQATTEIPSAPVIAEQILVESTEELTPPPTPPSAIPVEVAAVDINAPFQPLKLFFEPDHAELSADARVQLNQLADALLADDAKVIQLLAYASDNESSAQARRVSLSRALAVRGVLMERGIQSTRMHVRALGNKSKDGNPDRVEIIPVQN